MRALSRAQQKQKDLLVKRLKAGRSAIEEATNKFNEAARAIVAAQEEWGTLIDDVQVFMLDIADAQQDHYDSRSEKWCDSDAARTYEGWMDKWLADLPEVYFDEPEELDVPEFEVIEKFETLPVRVDA